MRKGFRKKGFSMIEVVVSLAIVIMIFAFLVPVFDGTNKAANEYEMKSLCLNNIRSIVQIFNANQTKFVSVSDSSLIFFFEDDNLFDVSERTENEEGIEKTLTTVTAKYDASLSLLPKTSESYVFLLWIRVVKTSEMANGNNLEKYVLNAKYVLRTKEYYVYPEVISYKEAGV